MAKSLKDLYKTNKRYLKEETNLNLMLDSYLLERELASKSRTPRGLHPSAISGGIDCPYYWYLRLSDTEGETQKESFGIKSLNAMVLGEGVHWVYQKTFYEMGILEGVWECRKCRGKFWAMSPKETCPICGIKIRGWDDLLFKEVPVNIGFLTGKGDGILNINNKRVWLEIKSIKNAAYKRATYGFEVLKDRPMDDHFIQSQLYMDCWYYIAKHASELSEVEVDTDGRVKVKKEIDPVIQGAEVIGPVDYGIIIYIAKNTSDRKAFLIKRNRSAIKFIMGEAKRIWKAFLECDSSSLEKLKDSDDSAGCKKCRYYKSCYAK